MTTSPAPQAAPQPTAAQPTAAQPTAAQPTAARAATPDWLRAPWDEIRAWAWEEPIEALQECCGFAELITLAHGNKHNLEREVLLRYRATLSVALLAVPPLEPAIRRRLPRAARLVGAQLHRHHGGWHQGPAEALADAWENGETSVQGGSEAVQALATLLYDVPSEPGEGQVSASKLCSLVEGAHLRGWRDHPDAGALAAHFMPDGGEDREEYGPQLAFSLPYLTRAFPWPALETPEQALAQALDLLHAAAAESGAPATQVLSMNLRGGGDPEVERALTGALPGWSTAFDREWLPWRPDQGWEAFDAPAIARALVQDPWQGAGFQEAADHLCAARLMRLHTSGERWEVAASLALRQAALKQQGNDLSRWDATRRQLNRRSGLAGAWHRLNTEEPGMLGEWQALLEIADSLEGARAREMVELAVRLGLQDLGQKELRRLLEETKGEEQQRTLLRLICLGGQHSRRSPALADLAARSAMAWLEAGVQWPAWEDPRALRIVQALVQQD